MKTLRSIFRRPMRVTLTISGIVIGVAALIVLGAMAEKINLLVDGGTKYYSDKVIVTDASTPNVLLPTPIDARLEAKVRKVPGVRAAYASAFILIEKDRLATFGPPPQIFGIQPDVRKVQKFRVTTAHGRRLRSGDKGVVVLGADLQRSFHARVGKTIRLRGKKFRVVGILDKQLNGTDTGAFITFKDMQPLLRKDLPLSLRQRLKGGDAASEIDAFPKKGVSFATLTKRIEKQVPGVKVFPPATFLKTVGDSTRIFNLIVVCVAFISLVVGGLSIINTMMMNVNERVREIGIRKAVGATSMHIVGQFMRESILISAIGGILGVGVGYLTVYLINRSTLDSALQLFTITHRLVAGALIFSLVLGMIAGLLPAIRAARLDPVRALRNQ